MPRLRCLLTLALLSSFGAAACGSAGAPAPVTSPSGSVQDFPTASAFVRHLASLAAAGDDAGLEAATDTSFAERLPSGPELRTLLGAVPSGCEPQLSEGPGYSAIAIPPPMVDDSDDEAARIEALIDELRATTEVDAYCTVVDPEDGEETLMLYTVAVRRGATGWRALAWRDHRLQ